MLGKQHFTHWQNNASERPCWKDCLIQWVAECCKLTVGSGVGLLQQKWQIHGALNSSWSFCSKLMTLKFIPWHTSWRDEHSAWRLVDECKELHAIVGDAPSCPEVRDRLNHIPNMLRYLGSLARNHFYGLITVSYFYFGLLLLHSRNPLAIYWKAPYWQIPCPNRPWVPQVWQGNHVLSWIERGWMAFDDLARCYRGKNPAAILHAAVWPSPSRYAYLMFVELFVFNRGFFVFHSAGFIL